MEQETIYLKLTRWYLGQASVEDMEDLDGIFTHGDAGELFHDPLWKLWNEVEVDETITKEQSLAVANKVLERSGYSEMTKSYHRVSFLRTGWFRYAASVILILGVVLYISTTRQHVEKTQVVATQNKEPGTDKAILTLSDGRQVVLDGFNNKTIDDGVISIGNMNGILSYDNKLTAETSTAGIHIVNTPRGGQYQLILPDGSKVWLNSASSIKYPVVFNGTTRHVELDGEAYFEVKENSKVPFVVQAGKAAVTVLGTKFNINAYQDEPAFLTTLISGSVKVSTADIDKIITPGQQAQLLTTQPEILTVKNDVDVSQVIAWQKGIFEFKGASLDIIARQISRWYDVDIKTNIVPGRSFRFSGGITKKTPLKTLLDLLEVNGVSNSWENNIITLYPENIN